MHHSHKHLSAIAQKKNKRLREKIILVTSVVYPLTTLAQIVTLYTNKSAENISLPMYALYVFFTLILLWYGIAEKLKPIIILQSLWFVMFSVVLVGILLYR